MQWRFRTVLVGVMLALLLTSVTIVGITAFSSASRSADALAGQVFSNAAKRAEDAARRQLDVASSAASLGAALLGEGRIDPRDPEAAVAFLLASMRAHPELSSMGWTLDATSDLVEVERESEGRLAILYQKNRPGGGHDLRRAVVDAGGQRHELPASTDARPGGPHDRPWYIAAQHARTATWTESYVFITRDGALGVPGVTRAVPVYEKDGTLLGVLEADFDFLELSAMVRGLDVSAHGSAFLIELRQDRTRRVIAIADPHLLTTAENKAVGADQIADPRVKAFLPEFDATIAGAQPDQLVRVSFAIDGGRYLGGYRMLQADRGLRWAVALAVPEDDILGNVKAAQRVAIAVTIGATIVALLAAIALGMWISSALRKLATETEAIGRFELAARPLTSPLVEFHQLSSAIEDMKRGLRSFRKFVPTDLVRRLMQSRDEAMQGGKRQTITVHFSDLVGFTSFSEKLAPEELVELLNEYLSLVSAEIAGSQGTLDKYIGDAVMAFWNAPTPLEDHAFIACKTALANRARIATLRETWVKAGKPAIAARVGLHTGEAVVGNIGSDLKLEFTAIGDTVNLASRLEGLGKTYGVEIMISETTYALVEGRVVVRPLDRVAVKGRERSLLVYELLGLAGEVDEATMLAADRHARAMNAYFAQEWDNALTLLAEASPTDAAAALLIARIAELRQSPPGDAWDGVHRMKTK